MMVLAGDPVNKSFIFLTSSRFVVSPNVFSLNFLPVPIAQMSQTQEEAKTQTFFEPALYFLIYHIFVK